MIRGLYTAGSGMLAGQRKQDTLINNLTNAETAGFKRDEVALRSFPELLVQRIRDQEGPQVPGTTISLPVRPATPIGPLSGGVYAHELIPRFETGMLQMTNNPLDVAIERDLYDDTTRARASLFFAVRLPNGEAYYTRDGRWTVNDAGELTTYGGVHILDEDGAPIVIGNNRVEISANGILTLIDPDDVTNTTDVRLGLFMSETPATQLIKGEHGYFRTAEGQALTPYDPTSDWSFNLVQGAYEGSNVDITHTWTQMIETMRYYEANQKVLQATDRTLEKAATEIGRV